MENNEFERYGRQSAWVREFSLPKRIAAERLKEHPSILGRDMHNHMHLMYAESVVRCAFADVLSIPIIRNGEFLEMKENEISIRYATATTWSRHFALNGRSTLNNLEDAPFIIARDTLGIQRKVYAEHIVMDRTSDLRRNDVPRAGNDGMIELENIKYATIRTWQKILGVSYESLKRRISEVSGITGIDNLGRVRDKGFYPEPAVRSCSSDMLTDEHMANEEGYFMILTEKFGTMEYWRKKFKVGKNRLRAFLPKEQAIIARDSSRSLREFFSESQVTMAFQLSFSTRDNEQ